MHTAEINCEVYADKLENASHPRSVALPRGSSACFASLRRAAANPEWADWAAGLPLATMEPFRGDGVRGLTVAVVRVAVEIIPNDGDFGSWLMPMNGNKREDIQEVLLINTALNGKNERETKDKK